MYKITVSLIILSAILLSGCTSKEWTLMVCDTKHFSGGCGDTKYVLKGYKTQRECMEKGIEMKNPEGFECGSACRLSDGGLLQVCDEVCNETGCS